MEQRLSLVTLGVVDLARSRRFYEEGLGWRASGASPGEVAFFQLSAHRPGAVGGEELAADAGLSGPGPGDGFAGVALAHNVHSRQDVDDLLARATMAGGRLSSRARMPLGRLHGELRRSRRPLVGGCLANPFFTLRDDGSLQLPP